MVAEALGKIPPKERCRRRLRLGFSTGTAAVAAARAALRYLLTSSAPEHVAVRLPVGYYLGIAVQEVRALENGAWASVIKDGGDDPDVTHGAEIGAVVGLISAHGDKEAPFRNVGSGICLTGGEGVGLVTKAGLPVAIGEPAINPVPREMLALNLTEELLWSSPEKLSRSLCQGRDISPRHPFVVLPLRGDTPVPEGIRISVEIRVPDGAELARRTLNPRLGILGGISILGTTGLVKPFSHEAYEETIQAALSVAAAANCREVVLSTGGKSEQFAGRLLKSLPEEAFVQIADFFAYAVLEARRMGFQRIVHSVFFGKALKMGQGHAYTHAHTVPLDLNPLAGLARESGYDSDFCTELASANTARHALEMLLERGARDVIQGAARGALDESVRLVQDALDVRLLLFDYDGKLLADVKR